MKDNKVILERFSNNMAYLDSEITKAEKKVEDKYDKLYSQADPVDRNGNAVVEMVPGQFTINCPKSDISRMSKDVRDEIAYINQCIDELEKITDEMPKNADYSNEEIQEFISKVATVNSKKYNPLINSTDNTVVKRANATGIAMFTTKATPKDAPYSTNLPNRVVAEARKMIGVPYVLGGYSSKGVDCSGLVCYAAKQAGHDIGRQYTGTLINMGTEVKRADLQIGDIIFPHSGHVGFYSGNGKFLHSPKPGDKVKEVNIYAFWRARRIFPGEGGDSTSSSSTSSGGSSGGNYSSDSYYGPGESLQLIERTPDPEVTKVVVPQGCANWSTMASYLGVSSSSLKALNPGISTLYAGTTLYIPTSSVTQARELAAKAKAKASRALMTLDDTVGLYNDNIMLTALNAEDSTISRAATASTVQEEATPFQTILNNEDYIKTHDLKEHKYNQKARIEIFHDGKVRRIQTLISPTSFSEVYSNSINVNQTAGGWFVSRHGENLPQLNINGYLLDTKYAPEKHAFMDEFKKYMTDTVNSSTGDYENNAIIKISMEGVEYQGHVTSINFNKDANRPTLYTFSMNFTCLYYKNVRDVQSAVNALSPKSKNGTGSSVYLADGLASIINS